MAIFVKTPGLSPVKTRLAAGIGKSRAEAFHLAASRAVAAVVTQAAEPLGAAGYFAVAEAEGMESPYWGVHRRIFQGHGGLGNRLHHVYASLLENHAYALLIGADTPQMERGDLIAAAHWLALKDEARFAFGPAGDGGFWLLGGNRPLPETVWTSVEYSRSDTGAEIRALVEPFGSILDLRELADVDLPADLPRMRSALRGLSHPAPEQVELISLLSDAKGDSSRFVPDAEGQPHGLP